jgi:hypothetical protein
MPSDAGCASTESQTSRWEAAMRRGDFEGAWRETDRLEIPRRELEKAGRFSYSPNDLLWNGQSPKGKRILVRCNHGLGDTLQFIRFVPLIRNEALSVAVFAQPPLVRLLGAAGNFGEVYDGWTTAVPPHDMEMEVMELAYAVRCTLETLPRTVPYLLSDQIRTASKLFLPASRTKLRVGLLWQASEWDRTRSVSANDLACFGATRHVAFFSLQQGASGDALPLRCRDLSPFTTAIPDLAAAMLQLDLIVTVDCMAAHLAGALGVPVWVLLKKTADWRWMDHTHESPWYPTMRLFRQSSPGDWTSVCQAVCAAFDEMAVAHPMPSKLRIPLPPANTREC